MIEMMSFGGRGEPGFSQGMAPHDVKFMTLWTYLGGKVYEVTYGSPPENFYTDLQTAQQMIDSFQIIQAGS